MSEEAKTPKEIQIQQPPRESMESLVTIRTSEERWLQKLAKAYKDRQPVFLVDDAGVGIDPATQSLFQMGKHLKLSTREWAAVLVSLGVGMAGIGMIVAAILDPEPTSKLGALLAGGVLCVFGGGAGAVRILIYSKPPTVKLTKSGIEIAWE